MYTYIYNTYAGNKGLNERKEKEQRQSCFSLLLFSSTLWMFNVENSFEQHEETKGTGRNQETD